MPSTVLQPVSAFGNPGQSMAQGMAQGAGIAAQMGQLQLAQRGQDIQQGEAQANNQIAQQNQQRLASMVPLEQQQMQLQAQETQRKLAMPNFVQTGEDIVPQPRADGSGSDLFKMKRGYDARNGQPMSMPELQSTVEQQKTAQMQQAWMMGKGSLATAQAGAVGTDVESRFAKAHPPVPALANPGTGEAADDGLVHAWQLQTDGTFKDMGSDAKIAADINVKNQHALELGSKGKMEEARAKDQEALAALNRVKAARSDRLSKWSEETGEPEGVLDVLHDDPNGGDAIRYLKQSAKGGSTIPAMTPAIQNSINTARTAFTKNRIMQQAAAQQAQQGPTVSVNTSAGQQPLTADQQALQWAQQNPADPRSAAIIARAKGNQ